jgi:hypothetical protein
LGQSIFWTARGGKWPTILVLKAACYATFESMNWRSWDLEIFDILLYAVIAALLLFVIYEAIP